MSICSSGTQWVHPGSLGAVAGLFFRHVLRGLTLISTVVWTYLFTLSSHLILKYLQSEYQRSKTGRLYMVLNYHDYECYK